MEAWYDEPNTSSRGRPQHYSVLAISTVLILKRVFRLTLRAAQGFIDAIFTLMKLPLRCSDHSCVSHNRRSVAETAMYRVKQLFGGHLTLRDYDAQVGKTMAMMCALNKMTLAGMPESVRIA